MNVVRKFVPELEEEYEVLQPLIKNSAYIKQQLGDNAYESMPISKITTCGEKDYFKYFLMQSGLLEDCYGWKTTYIVPHLRKALNNKIVATLILHVIIEDLLETDGDDYGEDWSMVNYIAKKVIDAWEGQNEWIKLSDSEYFFLVTTHFQENYKDSYELSTLQPYFLERDGIDIDGSGFPDPITNNYIKAKYIELMKDFFQEEETIEITSEFKKVHMNVPKYLKHLINGLQNAVEKLPATVETNLFGGTPEKSKSDDNKKTNTWRAFDYKVNVEYIQDYEVQQVLAALRRYGKYNHEMNMRIEKDCVNDYFNAMGRIMYYLSKEDRASYYVGARLEFERIFGLCLLKEEMDILCDKMKDITCKNGWKEDFSLLLRGIFLVENPFVRIYFAKKYLLNFAECWINGLANYETVVETLIDIDKFREKIALVEYGMLDSGTIVDGTKKWSKEEAIRKYNGFYNNLEKDFQGMMEELCKQKLNEKDHEMRATEISKRFKVYDSDVIDFVIKSNLGIYENNKVKMMGYEDR